jgi:hypothetical protein
MIYYLRKIERCYMDYGVRFLTTDFKPATLRDPGDFEGHGGPLRDLIGGGESLAGDVPG